MKTIHLTNLDVNGSLCGVSENSNDKIYAVSKGNNSTTITHIISMHVTKDSIICNECLNKHDEIYRTVKINKIVQVLDEEITNQKGETRKQWYEYNNNTSS